MYNLPEEVKKILLELEKNKYEAYIVGGCVRDLIMSKTPKDWDVTTNASPEEIQKIFSESFYENTFGTVTVKTKSEDESLKGIQVTTYRTEEKYSDKRHPDKVKFTKNIEDDLARRDFTMNAIAISFEGKIIDPFDGQSDISNEIVRTVGNANERFSEDALRLMRAVRFASTLNFAIESATFDAIKKNADSLAVIARERVRDELVKIVISDRAVEGIELLKETRLLRHTIPELLEGVGVSQNLHHIYNVWEHLMKSLGYSVKNKHPLEVRLAVLFHDIGKPRSKRGEGINSTFYGHDIIGARMAKEIMSRLVFSKKEIEKVLKLVRYHMFYYNAGEVTESSVRHLVANIGKENVEDLLKLREADRIGSGVPKAIPYKLRHLKFMIDKVARDPISPKMLKISGNDIMKLLSIEPSPKVGMILNALMEEVLEDPAKNTKEYLEQRAKQLSEITETELKKLWLAGKEKTKEKEEQEVERIKKKHYV